ncbi:MAG: thymidine kinase [Cetobacterium sp.]|uniref:thymidine kinase n=1 Tax=Cetobacterium sp. TaxID=2071632 RepID=UPI003EE4C162
MSKLYFNYSCMNAGKSLHLLSVAHNYEERGLRTVLLNYSKDNRFGENAISSRTGLSKPSIAFDETTCFHHLLRMDLPECDVVIIDEAQFLTADQVEELHDIAAIHLKIPVMCWGLRTDYMGNLFEGSAALMAHAETINEVKTICKCGSKATHTARVVEGKRITSGEQLCIGDSEYVSLCYSCFEESKD